MDQVAAVEDRDRGIERERRIDQEVIVALAANARIGMETGQHGIEIFIAGVDLPLETGVAALVGEPGETNLVRAERTASAEQRDGAAHQKKSAKCDHKV